MDKNVKGIIYAGIALFSLIGVSRAVYFLDRNNQFKEGLRVKFEDVVDSDKNGKLTVEEMVSACDSLDVNPAERFYELGFKYRFSIEEMLQIYPKIPQEEKKK